MNKIAIERNLGKMLGIAAAVNLPVKLVGMLFFLFYLTLEIMEVHCNSNLKGIYDDDSYSANSI